MEQQVIEQGVLASITSLNSYTGLKSAGVTFDSFNAYAEVFTFIESYVKEYNKPPSKELVEGKFSLRLVESPDVEYLVKELKRREFSRRTHDIIAKSIEFLDGEDNAEEAIATLSREILQLRQSQTGRVTRDMTDGDAMKRLDEYLERKAKADKGLMIGVKTGLSFFDELGGLETGTLLGVVANTAVGKSWMLLYLGCMAYCDNARVLFISPEMTIKQIGRRWDVVLAHQYGVELSNIGLIRGTGINVERYRQFLTAVQERHDWMTVDADEVGSAFTPNTIEDLIVEFKPGVVCIDGLPLIEYEGASKMAQWEKMQKISHALKTMAKAHSVVMMVSNQAVRGAEGKENLSPGDSGYSYSFSQTCDYAVMLARTKDNRENVRLVRPMKMREGQQPSMAIELDWAVDKGAIG